MGASWHGHYDGQPPTTTRVRLAALGIAGTVVWITITFTAIGITR